MNRTPILAFGEPSLHTPSEQADINDPALASQIEQLIEALTNFQSEHGWGRAMAAPQIGINKRFIAIRIDQNTQILINPQITRKSQDKMIVWDDCMSLPEIAVEVERHSSIDVTYTALNGQQFAMTCLPPDLSELLQHEIDHLDGIVMTDKIINGGALIKRDLVGKFKKFRELNSNN